MERNTPLPEWGGVRVRVSLSAGGCVLQHDQCMVFLSLHLFASFQDPLLYVNCPMVDKGTFVEQCRLA